MWLIIVIVALFLLFYFTGIKPLSYWQDRAVPSLKPWPYIGNFAEIIFRKRAAAYVFDDIYRAFSDRRYCGFYHLGTPTLMVRDPELIKKILVKEFETFPEHREFVPEDADPLWSKNLFAMRGGQKWQDARSTLSPSFTSSKMKMMFELMKDCSKQFSEYFLKQNGMVKAEMKDAFTRFTNDVIATTAFGVTCNSLENRTNEFYLMGKEITNVTALKTFVFLLNAFSPTLGKILNLPMLSQKTTQFFRKLVKETLTLRKEKGIVRPDMIHLLMEATKERSGSDEQTNEVVDAGYATVRESEINKTQKRQKSEITEEDITAHVMGFFFAGFDTVSTMMCYACYELAIHPDIQETLRKEIDTTLEEHNEDFTYESLMGMKYLDAVITETLRKWPPFVFNDRQSVRSYILQPERPDEKPLHLPKGSVCFIPTFSIQRDSKYYPDPEKFNPERFKDENKGNINLLTYLPFGAGPRNCIGSRFSLMEGKLIIAEVISKFEIVPVEKTPIPIQLTKKNFNPVPDEGFWLGLKPRT